MNPEIRRKDRVMKMSRDMEMLLEEAAIGRLAVTTTDGPYVVPVNYLFFEGNIYFHCAMSGRKIQAIQNDARVCFLVDEVGPQVLWERGCGISQIYRSVICFGQAEFVEDAMEKRAILERMIGKYVPTSHPMSDHHIERTGVVKIVVETMSGKAHDLSPSHTVIVNRFRPAESAEDPQPDPT